MGSKAIPSGLIVIQLINFVLKHINNINVESTLIVIESVTYFEGDLNIIVYAPWHIYLWLFHQTLEAIIRKRKVNSMKNVCKRSDDIKIIYRSWLSLGPSYCLIV